MVSKSKIQRFKKFEEEEKLPSVLFQAWGCIIGTFCFAFWLSYSFIVLLHSNLINNWTREKTDQKLLDKIAKLQGDPTSSIFWLLKNLIL